MVHAGGPREDPVALHPDAPVVVVGRAHDVLAVLGIHHVAAVLVVFERRFDADGLEPAGSQAHRAGALREHLRARGRLLDGDVGQTLVERRRDGVECCRVLVFVLQVEREADRLPVAGGRCDEAVERLRHVLLVLGLGDERVACRRDQDRARAAVDEKPRAEDRGIRCGDRIERPGDAPGMQERELLPVLDLVASIRLHLQRARQACRAAHDQLVEHRRARDLDLQGARAGLREVAGDRQSAGAVARRDRAIVQQVAVEEAMSGHLRESIDDDLLRVQRAVEVQARAAHDNGRLVAGDVERVPVRDVEAGAGRGAQRGDDRVRLPRAVRGKSADHVAGRGEVAERRDAVLDVVELVPVDRGPQHRDLHIVLVQGEAVLIGQAGVRGQRAEVPEQEVRRVEVHQRVGLLLQAGCPDEECPAATAVGECSGRGDHVALPRRERDVAAVPFEGGDPAQRSRHAENAVIDRHGPGAERRCVDGLEHAVPDRRASGVGVRRLDDGRAGATLVNRCATGDLRQEHIRVIGLVEIDRRGARPAVDFGGIERPGGREFTDDDVRGDDV